MITIDGSQGEGGGQILRTSLGLSLVTGQAVRVEKIRAKRSKPGLLRQHLTALQAAVAIGAAQVTGDYLGARELTFIPNGVRPGTYKFAIGTAGSASLVLQTVLPSLMLADAPSQLTLEGGTHNPFAPPYPFLEQTFLPLLARFGPRVTVNLTRAGFYPAGGGQMIVSIVPVKELWPMDLTERGKIKARRGVAYLANLPEHIAERELKVIQKKLSWQPDWLRTETLPAVGPGNLVAVIVEAANVTEVFTGFGEKGRSAELVAEQAVKPAKRYLMSEALAGEHLADQLLLPLALARGGAFTTCALAPHLTTNIATLKHFLELDFTIEEVAHKTWRVAVVT